MNMPPIVSPQEWEAPREELLVKELGVPGEVIDLLTYLCDEVLDGRNAYVTDGVQRAVGREPRDFADYAQDAAATEVWSASPVIA